MRTVIAVVVALALGAYFGNSYLEKKARQAAEDAERKRIEEAIKSAVTSMVGRTGAVDDWVSRVSNGERFRLEPILTVELERFWLQGRPILFVGSINDIASFDQSTYIVTIGRNFLSDLDYLFQTDLQLSLRASKQRIDSFLIQHPDIFEDFGFNNCVAVVATVTSIRTVYVPAGESHEQMKIGDGELLDIVFSGDVVF